MVIFENNKNKTMAEQNQLHERHFPTCEKSSPSTTAEPERKTRTKLHNLDLPCGWNNRLFRCVKDNKSTRNISNIAAKSGAQKETCAGNNNNNNHRPILAAENDDFGEYYLNCENGSTRNTAPEERSKVAEVAGEGDIQNAGNQLKEAVLSLDEVTGEVALGNEQPSKLRTRRANKLPEGGAADGGGGVGAGGAVLKLRVIKPKVDALRSSASGEATTSRRRRGAATPAAAAAASTSGENKGMEKLSVALGRREIEEDFMALLGRKPPRRPKKRTKKVQENLDTLFPGLLLTDINADKYKVTET